MEYFKFDDSIELWWMAKLDAQTGNKEESPERSKVKFRRHNSTSDTDPESSNDTDILYDWDS